MGICSVVIGKTARVSQKEPPCGPVTGSSIESWIYKSLCEVDGMAVGRLPVMRQTFQIETENSGGEIWHADIG